MKERVGAFKHVMVNSLLALSLATLPPQPLQSSEQTPPEIVETVEVDPRLTLIQKIYQERGVSF